MPCRKKGQTGVAAPHMPPLPLPPGRKRCRGSPYLNE
jgi:hypothetical protein